MNGITFDSTEKLEAICKFLDTCKSRPTVRLICDMRKDGFTWHQLMEPCKEISKRADIMIMVADSINVKDISPKNYEVRTQNAIDSYGQWAKYFEIGNELSGDWLGSDSAIYDKVKRAGAVVKRAGFPRVITWFYDAARPAEMISYMRNYPQEAEYHLLSWYPYWATVITRDWNKIFSDMVALVPGAKVGFGEFGTEPREQSDKYTADFITSIYAIQPTVPNWIGGGFYWDGYRAVTKREKLVMGVLSGRQTI